MTAFNEPNLPTSRQSPIVVLYAVVAVIIILITLLSGFIFARHRRRLRRERFVDWETSIQPNNSNKAFGGLALDSETSASDFTHGSSPIPLFMPVDITREARRSTRQAFSETHPTLSNGVGVSYSYPHHLLLRLPEITPSTRAFIDEGNGVAVLPNANIPFPMIPPGLLAFPQPIHVRNFPEAETISPPSNHYRRSSSTLEG